MRKNIEVVVIPWEGNQEGDGRSAGERASFEVSARYEAPEANEDYAKACARPFCKPGLAVIVRPRYDDGQPGYHEFRSFGGGAWYRCVFGPEGSSSVKEE